MPLRHSPAILQLSTRLHPHRTLSTTPFHLKKPDQLPPKPTLPDHELTHVYLKGSGPGGQKINKTNSAVQITHLPTGIVVKSQATRSQSQNHTIARRLLAEKVDNLRNGEGSRAAIKGLKVAKRKASADKKKRRKYKRLEGEGAKEGLVEDGEEHEVEGGEGDAANEEPTLGLDRGADDDRAPAKP